MENTNKTNCYFCHQPMALYEEANWRDNNYYCKMCPLNTTQSMWGAGLWDSPCIRSFNKEDNTATSTHLFFSDIEYRLSAYYDEYPSLEIVKDGDRICLATINTYVDIFSMPEDAIKKKLKTWITFS